MTEQAIVLGIDPGNTGALCLYDGARSQILEMWDMPIFYMLIGKRSRARIDSVRLMELMEHAKLIGADLMVLESVGGRPRQSASSAFVFGYGVGLIYMAAINARIPIETVAPQTWKKVLRCPKDERGIAQRADELFPDDRARWRGPKGGVMHDRAEAAMLALYGAQHMLHNVRPDAEWRLAYRKIDMGA